MSDQEFAKTFGRVAHAQIKDKAPMLLPYMLGFQVLDKSDDDTRAVGFFGFKVGDTYLFAPIFFLNGEIKGLDLLYVKDQNKFVPLQENWVNYIINRKPPVLGEGVDKDYISQATRPSFRAFGIPNKEAASEPEKPLEEQYPEAVKNSRLQRFEPWARPMIYDMAWFGQDKQADTRDLPTFLAEEGLMEVFLEGMKKNAQLHEDVLKVYSLDDFKVAAQSVVMSKRASMDKQSYIKKEGDKYVVYSHQSGKKFGEYNTKEEAKKRLQQMHAHSKSAKEKEAYVEQEADGTYSVRTKAGRKVSTGHKTANEAAKHYKRVGRIIAGKKSRKEAVALVERGDTLMEATLGDVQKEELLRDGYYIIDEREKTAAVYNPDFERQLFNPQESGVFHMLTDEGEFEPVLIIKNPKTFGTSVFRRAETVTVVRKNEAQNFVKQEVFLRHDNTKLEQNELGDTVGDTIEAKNVKVGKTYVFYNPQNGSGTFPCEIVGRSTDQSGIVQLWVKPIYSLADTHDRAKYTYDYKFPGPTRQYYDTTEAAKILDPQEDHTGYFPTRDRDTNEELLNVPVESSEPFENRNGRHVIIGKGNVVTYLGGTTMIPETFRAIRIESKMNFNANPGTLADLYTGLRKVAHDVRLYKDHNRLFVKVDGDVVGADIKPKKAAYWLTNNLGVNGAKSKEIVKLVEKEACVGLWVEKQAGTVDIPTEYDPNAYTDPILGVKTTTEYEREEPYKQTISPDLSGYINQYGTNRQDNPMIQSAMTAARQGQKEMFDTSVLSGLVKMTDTMSHVDSYLKDIILGMERVGRLLFLYYWHHEDFADRYGKEDMVEFEDSLRNVFKSTGDLVMFAKQRTIDTAPELIGADEDVGENLG